MQISDNHLGKFQQKLLNFIKNKGRKTDENESVRSDIYLSDEEKETEIDRMKIIQSHSLDLYN